jgi:hypothetical protein
MPECSAFTEFGLFEFSSDAPLPERIYDAIWANLGEQNFAKDGGYTDAKVYAWAMGLARGLRMMSYVGDQVSPDTVLDLLPAREYEFGIIAAASAEIADRRGELAAAMILAGGGTYGNISAGLTALLGSDFVSLRVCSNAETVTSPVAPETVGTWPAPSITRKVARISSPISNLGSQEVSYVDLDGSSRATSILSTGDRVYVADANYERIESVVLTAANDSFFTATFTQPHDTFTAIGTHAFPFWVSTRRILIVALNATASKDAVKRAKVHRYMAKAVGSTTQWAIAAIQGHLATTIGPFELDSTGQGVLDDTPLGQLSI